MSAYASHCRDAFQPAGQRGWRRAMFLALALLGASPAAAQDTSKQDYPNKPVRIVVGFAAGSVSDLVARVLAQKLGAALGQPFIVEVRAGAGSNVAAQHVVRSPKDGYTLFVATSSSTIRGAGAANLGFDFATDLAPVYAAFLAFEVSIGAHAAHNLHAHPGAAGLALQDDQGLLRQCLDGRSLRIRHVAQCG